MDILSAREQAAQYQEFEASIKRLAGLPPLSFIVELEKLDTELRPFLGSLEPDSKRKLAQKFIGTIVEELDYKHASFLLTPKTGKIFVEPMRRVFALIDSYCAEASLTADNGAGILVAIRESFRGRWQRVYEEPDYLVQMREQARRAHMPMPPRSTLQEWTPSFGTPTREHAVEAFSVLDLPADASLEDAKRRIHAVHVEFETQPGTTPVEKAAALDRFEKRRSAFRLLDIYFASTK